MIQYYTLEEAAQLLRIPPDKLKEMVKKNEIRAFQDRGTLRFRRQEIDEMVRARGLGSDPDLPLGDTPKSAGTPPSSASRRRSSKVVPDEGTVPLAEDQVPLADNPPSSSKKASPSSASGKRKTVGPKTSGLRGPASPYPKPASDSDVRLVSDGSDIDFHLELDENAPPKSKPPQSPKPAGKKKSQMQPPSVTESHVPGLPPVGTESHVPGLPPEMGGAGSKVPKLPINLAPDSDIKIEPDSDVKIESDSDVKIEGEGTDNVVPIGQEKAKSPSDSDIRLEGDPLAGLSGGKKRDDAMITEEIDLDAESAHIKEARQKAQSEAAAPQPPLPTTSPFELSENDLDMGMEREKKAAGSEGIDSSGDFELTATDETSPIELGSDERPKLPDGSSEEEVTLGELTGAEVGASGINMESPADSGLSLEGSEDEIEFDLSLDAEAEAGDAAAPATPSPSASEEDVEGSSEFELSLPDEEGLSDKAADSDSEFELTLDEESPGSSELELEGADAESSSDSEFELTLDEEGGLTSVDEETGAAAEGEEEGKDIFETDFDVPALDEESGSEAEALEEQAEGSTELEDSEFELDLDGDAEAPTDEETGSEEFASEEEEQPTSDEEEEPAPRPKRKTRMTRQAADEEDDEGLDISLDTDEEDEEAEEEEEPAVARAGAAVQAPPAQWGALPALMLLPSVIVLIVAGLMGYEMILSSWGFHKPAKVTSLVLKPLAEMITGEKLPDE